MQQFHFFSLVVITEKKYCFPPITHLNIVCKLHALILNLQSTSNVVTEYTMRENKLFLTIDIVVTQIKGP